MKSIALRWTAGGFAVLVSAVGVGGLTQALAGDEYRPAPPPVHFSGLINDYTPATVKNGPYEMRGRWSLDLPERGGTVHFSADMNMETTDAGNISQDDPTTRGAHTHHILVTDGVLDTSSTWKSVCPGFTPAVTGGFVVTGHANVTGNGGPPPFGNPSMVTICVLGVANPVPPGPHVAYSNMTLQFATPASTHFGSQAIHGVVSRCSAPWGSDSADCKLEQ
jgi:hypothetical protein